MICSFFKLSVNEKCYSKQGARVIFLLLTGIGPFQTLYLRVKSKYLIFGSLRSRYIIPTVKRKDEGETVI
jgi:hypothetical protein